MAAVLDEEGEVGHGAVGRFGGGDEVGGGVETGDGGAGGSDLRG